MEIMMCPEILADSVATGMFGVVLTTTANFPNVCTVLLDNDAIVGSDSTNR